MSVPEQSGDSKPPPLPVVPLPEAARLPAELRDARAWILWRAEWKQERTGWRLSKVPCDSAGKTCAMTDPNARGILSQTLQWVECVRKSRGMHYGIGLTFCAAQGFFALDLDGDLADGQSARLAWLTSTYRTWGEVSVGGRGAHLFFRGSFAGKRKIPWRGSKLEIFGSTGFIAMTGNALDGCPAELDDGAELLAAILSEGESSPEGRNHERTGHARGDDAELLRRMFASRKGADIRLLWGGAYPDDQSAGDLALCNHLAFWVGGPDETAIDRLFRQSGRMRPKWDERHSSDGSTYGTMTIRKALNGRTDYRKTNTTRATFGPSANGEPSAGPSDEPEGDEPRLGVSIILDYFRERYQPAFRRGNAIHCADGRNVPMGEACAVADSELIGRLAGAADAPTFPGGGLKRHALPGFFKNWGRVAWGDLLASLPEEDAAELASNAPAPEEFRRLVREAMLSEVVLGETIGKENEQTRTERRSLIDWCERFAKPGPWRSIRSKKCWCKHRELAGGEVELMIAVRHELFAQLKADRRLCEMGATTFSRRAARYRVGSSTPSDRPHGLNAVVLDPCFVADLIAELPDDSENVPPER